MCVCGDVFRLYACMLMDSFSVRCISIQDILKAALVPRDPLPPLLQLSHRPRPLWMGS